MFVLGKYKNKQRLLALELGVTSRLNSGPK